MKEFLTVAAIMLTLDLLFLGTLGRELWKSTVSGIQNSPMTLRPGFAFVAYCLLVLGIYTLVWKPHKRDLKSLILHGAIFGMVIYGVFDFTNGTIFQEYPLSIMVIDTIWGTFLCAFTVGASYYLLSRGMRARISDEENIPISPS